VADKQCLSAFVPCSERCFIHTKHDKSCLRSAPLSLLPPPLQLLLYLSRAYYDSDDLYQAKQVLLQALHRNPADYQLWFNLALTMQVSQRAHLCTAKEEGFVEHCNSICGPKDCITLLDLNISRS